MMGSSRVVWALPSWWVPHPRAGELSSMLLICGSPTLSTLAAQHIDILFLFFKNSLRTCEPVGLMIRRPQNGAHLFVFVGCSTCKQFLLLSSLELLNFEILCLLEGIKITNPRCRLAFSCDSFSELCRQYVITLSKG